MDVKADSRVEWNDTDYSDMLGDKRDLIEYETNSNKAREMERVMRKDLTKLVKAAQKMYDTRPTKEYYDFLVMIESADKALKV